MASPVSILDDRPPVEFRIGDVLVKSWNVLMRHFLIFVALSAAALLPQFLLSLRVFDLTPALNALFPSMVRITFSTLAQSIVIYAAFQDLRGRNVAASESVSHGLARFFPAMAAALLVTVIVVVAIILLVVPGLIASAALAVVIPVCVVERAGPIRSLSRSSELTRGYWWHIIGVSIAMYIIRILVTFIVARALPLETKLVLGLDWFWGVLVTAYQSVFAAILYHDLRAVKEGIGIDEIAAVFD
jgi:hypothetical protein